MTALTLNPDATLARMRIVVDDAAGGTLTRTGPDGRTYAVRAGKDLTGDHLIDDYECPLGVPVTYALDGVEQTGQLDVDTPWLTHPTMPTLNLPVTLVDDDDWTWSAPGTVHEPIDSPWPVVVWTARSRHEGTLRLSSSWDQRHAIVELCEDGAPLLLRVPPGCYADDGWLWPSSIRRRKSRAYDPSSVSWELTYPASPYSASSCP